MTTPYTFYFSTVYGVVTFPITPESITMTLSTKNETKTLISGLDINILKSPELREFQFESRFPTRKYPFSKNPSPIEDYIQLFERLVTEKKPFTFLISRTGLAYESAKNTKALVSLEKFEIKEDANEGDDFIISFQLKEYREYGVQFLPRNTNSNTSSTNTTSTSPQPRNNDMKDTSQQSYTVKDGDCLYTIAKMFYDEGERWTEIYEANKTNIEEDAKKHGFSSSSNGHWIWAGLELTIPEK